MDPDMLVLPLKRTLAPCPGVIRVARGCSRLHRDLVDTVYWNSVVPKTEDYGVVAHRIPYHGESLACNRLKRPCTHDKRE